MRKENTLESYIDHGFIGKVHLLEVGSAPSTNSLLLEMAAKSNLSSHTALFTFNQTHGRGQLGREWITQPYANLAFSLLLRPSFNDFHDLHFLTMDSALKAQKALADLTKNQVEIKWPNDIYVQNLKIAGILIEQTRLNEAFPLIVCGIGINVLQTSWPDHFPATSVKLVHPQQHANLFEVVQAISNEWNELPIKSYGLNEKKAILEEYNNHLWQKDKLFNIYKKEQLIYSNALGKCVNESGKLEVFLSTGDILEVMHGQYTLKLL